MSEVKEQTLDMEKLQKAYSFGLRDGMTVAFFQMLKDLAQGTMNPEFSYAAMMEQVQEKEKTFPINFIVWVTDREVNKAGGVSDTFKTTLGDREITVIGVEADDVGNYETLKNIVENQDKSEFKIHHWTKVRDKKHQFALITFEIGLRKVFRYDTNVGELLRPFAEHEGF